MAPRRLLLLLLPLPLPLVWRDVLQRKLVRVAEACGRGLESKVFTHATRRRR